MKKVYQVLVVSRAVGFNFIIPDTYVYSSWQDARNDIERRKIVFEADGENLDYKGTISGLEPITAIYNQQDVVNDTNDAYIYELEVR